MSTVAKRLIAPVLLPTAVATHYTAVNVRTILDKVTVTNVTTSAALVTMHLVPSTGTASATNTILNARSIAAGETYHCPGVVGHTLEAGETLQAYASTASALSLRASGREVSL